MGVGVLLGTEVAGEGVSCCRVWQMSQEFDEGFRGVQFGGWGSVNGFQFRVKCPELKVVGVLCV